MVVPTWVSHRARKARFKWSSKPPLKGVGWINRYLDRDYVRPLANTSLYSYAHCLLHFVRWWESVHHTGDISGRPHRIDPARLDYVRFQSSRQPPPSASTINDADAEEAAQEAVLKAFTLIGRFRGECKFSTWLIQITINESRCKLRKQHRHLYESVDEPRSDKEGDYWPRDFADWREIPSEALERKELRQALRKVLDSLAPKYRQVLILRDVQHLS